MIKDASAKTRGKVTGRSGKPPARRSRATAPKRSSKAARAAARHLAP